MPCALENRAISPAFASNHCPELEKSAAPGRSAPVSPRSAGALQPVPTTRLPDIAPKRRMAASRAPDANFPMATARFAHQIVHHGENADAADGQASAAKRFYSGHTNADPASGNAWQTGWQRTIADWQTQREARRQHFHRQTDHLHEMASTSHDRQDLDGMFASIDIAAPRRPDLSLDLLAAAPAARLIHACGAAAHQADAPFGEEPAHEHTSMIAVDLDETAHGAYASSKYLGDAFSGNPERVAAALRDEASLLSSAPRQAIAEEAVPHGVSDFAAAIGASAVMLPLAGMAIHAGIHEIRHARGELKRLGEKEAALRRDAQEVETLADAVPGVRDELALKGHARKAIAFARKLARLDFGIGVSSALSGSAIAVKSAFDIGWKSALVAAKQKFSLADVVQQGTQIGTAGLVTGAAGTLVLSPLAGIFATTLGIFFVRKSAAKHRQLKHDVALARQDIRANLALIKAAGVEKAEYGKYQAFIDRQADKRIAFFRGFRRWNRAFLVGSGLYAASATTKMAVTAAALAGLGAAASNPIALGVLLGVGIGGALIMGGASLSFLKGHDKQGRFSRHTSQDHDEVDREMLAALDLVSSEPQPGQRSAEAALKWSSQGLNVRAQCLQRLDKRKKTLQGFLAEAAEAQGKLKPGDPGLHVWGKLSCNLKTGWRYAKTLATTCKPEQARLDAREAHMAYRKDLGSRHIEEWICSSPGENAFLRFAKADLLAKADFLVHKLEARFSLTGNPLAEVPNHAGDVLKSTLATYASHVSKQDALIEKDQAELERCRALLVQIKARLDDPDRSRGMRPDVATEPGAGQLMANLRDYFGGAGKTAQEEQPAERSVSKALVGGLQQDVKDARGVLFETQLQASRIRDASSKTATAPTKDKPAKQSFWKFLRRKQQVPESGAQANSSVPGVSAAPA